MCGIWGNAGKCVGVWGEVRCVGVWRSVGGLEKCGGGVGSVLEWGEVRGDESRGLGDEKVWVSYGKCWGRYGKVWRRCGEVC